MKRHLLLIILICVTSLSALAQSFRIHRGLEVIETREPLLLAEHSDADSIVVKGATFDLAVTDVTQTSCTLHVTPSNDGVRYYYDICTRQTLEGQFQGSVSRLVEGYLRNLYEQYSQTFSLEVILDETLSIGTDQDELQGLPAGTDMAFYAIAVDDEGHCYGDPALTYFTTDPAGNPADCKFYIEVSNVRSQTAIINIAPTDASIPYWYGICAVDEWPGDYAMTADVSNAIYEYAQEYGTSISNVASRVVYTGNISMEESGLSPSTAYYAYCYAMDTSTGDALGPVYKIRFKTTDYDLSEATLALSVKYFDGDALQKAYPERFTSSISGRCYLQVMITPNLVCHDWVVALAKGDLTDPLTYPDEITKNAVLQGGKISHTLNNFVCDWTTCTLIAFGVDAAGVDGELQRNLITFTKDKVSPVDEFILDEPAPFPLSTPSRTKQIINKKYQHYEKVHLFSSPCHRRGNDGLCRRR